MAVTMHNVTIRIEAQFFLTWHKLSHHYYMYS